jgi:DNA-binding XRE family transcriptional regulator
MKGPVVKTNTKLEKSIRAKDELYERIENDDIGLIEAVKLIRKVLGLNQIEYAKKVDVATSTVINLERGEGNLTLKNINKMLKPMKLTLKIGIEG